MDDDAPVLAALGILLTQLRTARRALEDVQRNTARYAGFDFARAFAEGPRFGQPPLFEGALMVHVVNINDLAPGNGFGGFIEALFGGIGNFFSNLVGGLISGTLSGFALPDMIGQLERIVAAVERIIPQLGLGEHKPEPGKEFEIRPRGPGSQRRKPADDAGWSPRRGPRGHGAAAGRRRRPGRRRSRCRHLGHAEDRDRRALDGDPQRRQHPARPGQPAGRRPDHPDPDGDRRHLAADQPVSAASAGRCWRRSSSCCATP